MNEVAGHLYVYVIGYDAGPQKIGVSNHPPTRARTLRATGQPHLTIHFARIAPKSDALGIERLAHWILRKAALGRERFDVEPGVAIHAVCDAAERYAAGERAPPRDDLMTERCPLKVPDSFVREVEEWCKRQPGRAPTFSEAVRILTERAIQHERGR